MAAKAFSYSGFIAGPVKARMVARFCRDGSDGLRAEQFPQVPDRRVDRALELFLRLQLVHELAQIRIREFVFEGPRHLGSCLRQRELEAGRAGLQEALGLSERVHGVLATFG